jgi:hypothetical protein
MADCQGPARYLHDWREFLLEALRADHLLIVRDVPSLPLRQGCHRSYHYGRGVDMRAQAEERQSSGGEQHGRLPNLVVGKTIYGYVAPCRPGWITVM